MNLVSISGWLKDLVSTLSGLGFTASGIFAVGAFALLYSRTSSAHPVLTQLWTRVFGKLAIHDSKIQEYVDELNNLSRFTFLTRIRSNTLHDVHKLLDWRKKWNVAISQVRACGSYFDLTLPGLKNGKSPGEIAVGLVLFLAACPTVLGAISGVFMVPDSALLTFTTSHDWLWLSEASAVRFPAHGKKTLEQRDCTDPLRDLSQRTGFAEVDIKMLCSFFKGKDISPAGYVEGNVEQNRLAFGAAAVLLFSCSLPLWADWRRGTAANRLAEHLQKHEDRLGIACSKTASPAHDVSNVEVAVVSDDPGKANTLPISEPGGKQPAIPY